MKKRAITGPSQFEQILFIDASVKRVWKALVTKNLVDKYYLAPLGQGVKLEVGGLWYYGDLPDPIINGKVIELDSLKLLTHSFSFAHQPDDPHSLVTYHLIDRRGITQLDFVHRFDGSCSSLNDVRRGWPVILSSLKTLLETGRALKFKKDAFSNPRK